MNRGGVRGGTRGGQDQFDWEDVKVDKDRENYLGHSVKASVGRWQKGRDLTWYNKESKVAGQSNKLQAELTALKRAEEEAMAAALGLKPPASVKPQQALTRQELADACRRRSMEDTEGNEERVKGIGYQSRRAQAMFVGTKNNTTKEGATVFEHDSEHNDDGKLKMARSSRPSESDLVTPTTPAKQLQYGPSVASAVEDAASPHLCHVLDSSESMPKKRKRYDSDQSTSPVRVDKKGRSDKKISKKKREKKKKRHHAEETESENDWTEVPPSSRREGCERSRHKHSLKRERSLSPQRRRRRHSSSSESNEKVWAETSTKKSKENRSTDSHHHHHHHHKHHSHHRHRQTDRNR